MSEPARPRRWFTLRRVVAGVAAALFVALAWVCVDVWRVERRSPWVISVTGFEWAQGRTSMVAVMTFTNTSYRTFSLHEVGTNGLCWAQFFGEAWPKTFDEWRPGDAWPKTLNEWRPPRYPTRGFRDVPPGTGWRFTVEVPQDGRKGRVGLWLGERISLTKRLRVRLAEWLSRRKGARPDSMVVLTEEFIECPRLQPDGTLEPGRILPKGGTR